ncbi:MAG: hypothetical protein LLF96_01780, partial [Eubacteriales bacterium]|nr:hypothetical protein [Eubacteriales bacterium]
SKYSWTAISRKGSIRIDVKTSIDKQSQAIWRVIVEREFDEIIWWGSTIDHINNNPLDNRKANLHVFSTAILNSTNISSKFTADGMQYIHKQGNAGYKFHCNLGGKTYYKNFGKRLYGSMSAALVAAKEYSEFWIREERPRIIQSLVKKTRDVEFERGLREKLNIGEMEEIMSILSKYGMAKQNE